MWKTPDSTLLFGDDLGKKVSDLHETNKMATTVAGGYSGYPALPGIAAMASLLGEEEEVTPTPDDPFSGEGGPVPFPIVYRLISKPKSLTLW